MKIVTIIFVSLMLISCGKVDLATSGITGAPSKICVDGVTYLQFTSGVSVQIDKNFKPIECK